MNANQLRRIANQARAIPGKFGLREHAVYILEGYWGGTHTGDGDETLFPIRVLENGQNPRVRWLTDEQLALANGLTDAKLEIGPVTPSFGAGGTDLDALAGRDLDTGNTLHVNIVGPKHPDGARYAVTEIRADRALRYMLRCKPVV
jgi:hypothetical protein